MRGGAPWVQQPHTTLFGVWTRACRPVRGRAVESLTRASDEHKATSAADVGDLAKNLVAMRDVSTSADYAVIAEVAKQLEALHCALVVFSIDEHGSEQTLALTDEERDPVTVVNTTRGPHAHFDLAVPVGDVCAFYRAAEVRGRLEASDSRTVVGVVGVWRVLWTGAPRPWPLPLAAHRGSPWCRMPARLRPRTCWRPIGEWRGKSNQ